jgi:hypothetical protein
MPLSLADSLVDRLPRWRLFSIDSILVAERADLPYAKRSAPRDDLPPDAPATSGLLIAQCEAFDAANAATSFQIVDNRRNS